MSLDDMADRRAKPPFPNAIPIEWQGRRYASGQRWRVSSQRPPAAPFNTIDKLLRRLHDDADAVLNRLGSVPEGSPPCSSQGQALKRDQLARFAGGAASPPQEPAVETHEGKPDLGAPPGVRPADGGPLLGAAGPSTSAQQSGRIPSGGTNAIAVTYGGRTFPSAKR
jgi:hypothetical protein